MYCRYCVFRLSESAPQVTRYLYGSGYIVYALRHVVRKAQVFLRREIGPLPVMQVHWRGRERNGIEVNSASSIEKAFAPKLEEIKDEEEDECFNHDHEIHLCHI